MSFADARLVPEFPGRPSAATAGCYACGTHRLDADPGVLDSGLNVHMEGRVYFCLPCVEHLANVIGLLDRATADRVRAKNAELAENNRRLGIEVKSLKGTISAQQELLASYSGKK